MGFLDYSLRNSGVQFSYRCTVKPAYIHSHYFPEISFPDFLYLTSCRCNPKADLGKAQTADNCSKMSFYSQQIRKSNLARMGKAIGKITIQVKILSGYVDMIAVLIFK